MKHLFKLMLLSCLCVAAFSLTACGDDEPNDDNNQETSTDYFDKIQGLWMMVKTTDVVTNQTTDLDGNNYRYCYIYADGETLYGQSVSYPSMSKGKKIELTLDGETIMSDGKKIGKIRQCGKEGLSKIELVVEWISNQEVFNPYNNGCVAYYWRDTWTKL